MLFLSLTLSLSVLANPVPEFPFVIVTERLEERVEPDSANIKFEIIAYEVASEKAMESLTKSSAKMLKLLKEHDLPLSQLESTQVDKSTRRARKEGVYNLDILGYEVEQSFTLKINALEKYPGFMNALVRLDGVQDIEALFETSKEEKYKEKLIVELSAKARRKADVLAHAQSRKVKSVYGITTGGDFRQEYATFSLEHESTVLVSALKTISYGMDFIMAVPEYIQVGQRITAIYELK